MNDIDNQATEAPEIPGEETTSPKGTDSVPKPPRDYQKSGLYLMKRAVRELGSRAVDKRTKMGRTLAEFRAELTADEGGEEQLTRKQKVIIDEIINTKLITDSVTAWILSRQTLVNVKKRSLLPVIKERQQLVDSMARLLSMLGLQRKARQIPDLQSYLQQKSAEKVSDSNHADSRPESAEEKGNEKPAI